MAYYVLVEVENDEDARNVASALNDEGIFRLGYGDAPAKTEVRAVWRKPTLACDNSDGHRKRKTQSGWTRGRKWGWWVCAICGKPSLGWVAGSLWRFDSVFGYNLLPDSIIGKRPAHTGRSPEEWTWLDSSSNAPQ